MYAWTELKHRNQLFSLSTYKMAAAAELLLSLTSRLGRVAPSGSVKKVHVGCRRHVFVLVIFLGFSTHLEVIVVVEVEWHCINNTLHYDARTLR